MPSFTLFVSSLCFCSLFIQLLFFQPSFTDAHLRSSLLTTTAAIRFPLTLYNVHSHSLLIQHSQPTTSVHNPHAKTPHLLFSSRLLSSYSRTSPYFHSLGIKIEPTNPQPAPLLHPIKRSHFN
ncbi:MAG: hypothetical protein JOS17DRAFT_324158 [Linnemannia elongata]|nr:MAG: hypothetical protein JOS17DRAFT_324158 [Linnemannia elongata]